MKKNLEKILSFSFLFCIILFSKTFAENGHKVHEHGTSNITIAIENNVLQIQLEAPLIDIAGFEGEPKTKLQKQICNKQKQQKSLSNPFVQTVA